MGIGAISLQNNLARSIRAADVHTWQPTGPVLDVEKPHSRRNSPKKLNSTLSVIVLKKKENSLNVLWGRGGRKGKSGTTFIQQQPINTVLVLLLYTTILHDTVLYHTRPYYMAVE